MNGQQTFTPDQKEYMRAELTRMEKAHELKRQNIIIKLERKILLGKLVAEMTDDNADPPTIEARLAENEAGQLDVDAELLQLDFDQFTQMLAVARENLRVIESGLSIVTGPVPNLKQKR